MKLSYCNPYITLYEGDSCSLPLKENTVDCIVTDPPYNIGKDFGNGRKADLRDDYTEWLNSIWVECGRVAKEGSFLIFTNRIAYLPQMFTPPLPWRFFHVAVWHKPLSLAGTWYGITPHWEPIAIWVKGPKPWEEFRNEQVFSDVFSHSVIAGSRRAGNNHPTVKPVSHVKDLILFGCPPKGLLCDPFAGSGTTLVAAQQLGYKAVGIELSAHYCRLAQRRLEVQTLPMRL